MSLTENLPSARVFIHHDWRGAIWKNNGQVFTASVERLWKWMPDRQSERALLKQWTEIYKRIGPVVLSDEHGMRLNGVQIIYKKSDLIF